MLPYINETTDYKFLTKKSDFIVSRFMNSLAQHIKDNSSQVGIGFMILALKINPILV